MKKAIILFLVVGALAISGSSCKKKTKIKKTKIEKLDKHEVAGYRNSKMTKELM